MKIIIKNGLYAALAALIFTACNKVDDLPFYGNGTAPQLSASTQTFAATATDAANPLVTFTWTYPNYATDSSNHKYLLEIDSAGRNFSHAASRVINGSLSTTFTGEEMNSILLGLGFAFEVPYPIEARVVSSYGNNNERLYSNTISITAKAYRVPPKVELPFTGHLYIVGGATDFGWNNVNPMPPIRELTLLDETTYGAIYHMSGDGGYLLLPEAGSWNNKYSINTATAGTTAESGEFGYNFPNDFMGSLAQGNNWYKMIFNFQNGRYNLTKLDNAMGEELYITGDGTPSSWTNSPPPEQRMTMVTNGVFEITMAFTPGKLYKFLNTNGQWQPQFGGDSSTGGDLGANYGNSSDPSAIPTPAEAGNYKVQVNFITNKYTVTRL